MQMTATIPGMGKKKIEAEQPQTVDPHKGLQINLRLISQELLELIAEYARATHRSRNNAINVLIERGLKAEGFLPG